MASYCLSNGVELWYKPRTKWVRYGSELSWDNAVSVQDTLRKMKLPCYIVINAKRR